MEEKIWRKRLMQNHGKDGLQIFKVYLIKAIFKMQFDLDGPLSTDLACFWGQFEKMNDVH